MENVLFNMSMIKLLFNHSEEDDCEGLKLIDGRIKKFNFNIRRFKSPPYGMEFGKFQKNIKTKIQYS